MLLALLGRGGHSGSGPCGSTEFVERIEDLLAEPTSPQSRRPDEDLYHKEIWGSYQRCAAELKPKSRKVMELRLLEQFTQKEISQELRIPQGTVGVMIMQILEAVRRCLAARGIVP
ncbi:MAG: sigma-70 family RNA polymerase sigma factor [Proteobacteria bacterium]|nr:sigma-70 family RNA polymerase sigma factor [Pseudomonadota bacterium]